MERATVKGAKTVRLTPSGFAAADDVAEPQTAAA
jgi:hypothetical protein